MHLRSIYRQKKIGREKKKKKIKNVFLLFSKYNLTARSISSGAESALWPSVSSRCLKNSVDRYQPVGKCPPKNTLNISSGVMSASNSV